MPLLSSLEQISPDLQIPLSLPADFSYVVHRHLHSICQNSLPQILIIQQKMALTSSLAGKEDFILTFIHLMSVRHGTLDPSTHYLTASVAAAAAVASPSPSSSSPPFPLSHLSFSSSSSSSFLSSSSFYQITMKHIVLKLLIMSFSQTIFLHPLLYQC